MEDTKAFIKQQAVEHLNKLQCKAWYTNAIPFSAASDQHMQAYLEAVKTAPADYQPLKRKQLSSPECIDAVEKDVRLLEDALVSKSGGGVCLSTDGGEVGHAATRAVLTLSNA